MMIIYKTTNVINGKFYVGKDIKNDPKYLGSGLLLIKAIKKYGKENFNKEILEVCESIETLNSREKYWISELNAIQLGYNIARGGSGGDTITNNPNKDKIRKTLSKNCIWKSNKREEYIKKYKHLFSDKGNPMYGKKHSNSTKEKIGNRKYSLGKEHHNFGKKNVY